MIVHGRNSSLWMFAACALLFVAAQTVASAHSLDHDTGISPGQACATCVAVSHMSAACVDHTPTDSPVSRICHLEPELTAAPDIVDVAVYHQRAPPISP